MFLGADSHIFENARSLRDNLTLAETILWAYLRKKSLGSKFRRQHPISIYIADFYCHALKLIIEVDGGIHADAEVRKRDLERQNYLESEGISFLRFTNDDVEKRMELVIEKIEEFIKVKPQIQR